MPPVSSPDITMLYLFHVHVVFSILAFFSLFLLYRWIITTQPSYVQGRIAAWMLILSGIGVAATVPFCLAGMRLMHGAV